MTPNPLNVGIKECVLGLNGILRMVGCELVPSTRLYDWQRITGATPLRLTAAQTESSDPYLSLDNPRLNELRERYARFRQCVTEPFIWNDDFVKAVDVKRFRGETPYVWQQRGRNMNPIGYCLAAYYMRQNDPLALFESLPEDNAFGAHTLLASGRVVSRDLLDSINEINFLERHLGISRHSRFRCLDIGAGYGRLAHRVAQVYSKVDYICTDAIAVSTFVCEHYLRFRKVDHVTTVTPLDEIEKALDRSAVHLALNVHSFSECTTAAVAWWMRLLGRHDVPFLMLVPNAVDEKQRPLTNARQDLASIIEAHGYRLVVQEPKYHDPLVQEYGINPTYYYLFELR